MKPNWKRNGVIYIIILLAAVILFSFLMPGMQKPDEVPLSRVVAMSQDGKIAEIEIDEETLLITTVDGKKLQAFKESNASIFDIEGLNLDPEVVDAFIAAEDEILSIKEKYKEEHENLLIPRVG